MIPWTTCEDAIWNWVVTGSGLASSKVFWAGQRVPRPTPPYITIRVTGVVQIGQDWKTVTEVPLVFADLAATFTDATDTVNVTAHGLQTGDGPVRLTTTGALPSGLAVATDYWVIRAGADTLQLATTFLNARNLVPLAFGTGETGTHALVDTSSTRRAGAEISHNVQGARELVLSLQCFDGGATGAGSPMGLLEKVKTAHKLPSVHAGLRTAGVGVARFGNVASVDGSVGSALFEPRAFLEVRAFVSSEVSEITTYIQRAQVTMDPPGTGTFTVDIDP